MMPRPGQYTFESPQLARYDVGQHFLSHEVGLACQIVVSSLHMVPNIPNSVAWPSIFLSIGPVNAWCSGLCRNAAPIVFATSIQLSLHSPTNRPASLCAV